MYTDGEGKIGKFSAAVDICTYNTSEVFRAHMAHRYIERIAAGKHARIYSYIQHNNRMSSYKALGRQ